MKERATRQVDRQGTEVAFGSETQARVDVVAVGHILSEIVSFSDRQFGPVLGGPAAYSSVAASRFGMRCGIVTIVGQSPVAELLRPLTRSAVDVSGVRHRGRAIRTSRLTYHEHGKKTIAYESVPPPIVLSDFPSRYRDARAFLVVPMDFEVAPSTVAKLRSSETEVLMTDLGGYGGTVASRHPVDDKATAAEVQQLTALFDVVKASAEDCEYLWPETLSPERAAQRFVDWGASVGLVTIGSAGAIVVSDGHGAHHVPALAVTARDETGAGDVFCGVFLAEYLNTGQLGRAVRVGAAAASIMTEATGGVSPERMPTREDVLGRLDHADQGWQRASTAS